jgi:hypothetical protein
MNTVYVPLFFPLCYAFSPHFMTRHKSWTGHFRFGSFLGWYDEESIVFSQFRSWWFYGGECFSEACGLWVPAHQWTVLGLCSLLLAAAIQAKETRDRLLIFWYFKYNILSHRTRYPLLKTTGDELYWWLVKHNLLEYQNGRFDGTPTLPGFIWQNQWLTFMNQNSGCAVYSNLQIAKKRFWCFIVFTIITIHLHKILHSSDISLVWLKSLNMYLFWLTTSPHSRTVHPSLPSGYLHRKRSIYHPGYPSK